jgi:thymidylate synthase
VVTLWSKVDYVIERFRQAGVDLDPATSPIAVFGTLYGNVLREMLRNLLYNPQIRLVVGCGNDRSDSWEELFNFFKFGMEPVQGSLIQYKKPEPGVEVHPCRIRGTKRVIDDLVRPEHFPLLPRLELLADKIVFELSTEISTRAALTVSAEVVGRHSPVETNKTVESKDDSIKSEPNQDSPAPEPDISQGSWEGTSGTIERIRRFPWQTEPVPEVRRLIVPLPEVEVQYFPSNPRGHVVVRETILEAWKEVLHLLTRFGRRVTLKKGDRLELQHVKVVVEKPRFETEEKLKAVNIDPLKLRQYQEDILKGELRGDETYKYGHRLRTHFGLDTLAACVERLKKDPEDRKVYVALWDTRRDLTIKEGRPCLVSLFFRKFENKLTLSATFRTHNAMDAYPMNLYGLKAIQNWVAERVGLPLGAITVVSHSLGLDPKELDRALMVIGKRPFKVRLDPMGYFRITLDGKEILVEHRFEDVTLKEYRGKKAERLQHEIARDVALSDINHAIYLGRQLAKAEMALKEGREFVQD